MASPPSPSLRAPTETTAAAAPDLEPVEADAETGPGGQSRLGKRPAVFRSTLQEVLFVFQATAAVMTTSFLAGTTMIITASIGRDLAMTQAEITWIGASTS